MSDILIFKFGALGDVIIATPLVKAIIKSTSGSSCTLVTTDPFVSIFKNWDNLQIKILDIGGGIPVSYSEDVLSPNNFGSVISKKINEFASSIGDNFTLIVESGRFLTAESCVLISKIVNSKSFIDKKFLIVDSGYHLLLDSALINHEYPIHLINNSKSFMDSKVTIVGRLCDSLDVFNISDDKKFSAGRVKDLVVFKSCSLGEEFPEG